MWGLQVLSGAYRRIAGFKNFLYDEDYFQSVELPIPVLSIGNLTVGGTGKTPLTDFCLKYYQRRKVKLAVVSRNYRAQVKSIAEVDVRRTQAAQFFGDEPVLLASRNPQCKVFVGPKKFQTAQYAYHHYQPELIVVDDGFQHRKLHRDVDLVILDATELEDAYQCLPLGRAREPKESLKRATALILTKVNFLPVHQAEILAQDLAREYAKPVFSFSYEILRLFHHQNTESEKSLKDAKGLRCLLVSGLASPQAFEKNLRSFELDIVKHRAFADHHPYGVADLKSLREEWQALGKPDVVTTEKDYTKLKSLWPEDIPLWVAPLEVSIKNQEDSFYEILDQVLH